MKKIYLLVTTLSLTLFSVGQLFSQTITVVENLTAFEKCNGSVSASQNFSVSGTNLPQDILIEDPTGLEYSIDDVTFSVTLTLAQSLGVVNATTVYVRMTAGDNLAINGDISITSGNEVSQPINNVTGSVTALPVATFSYAGTPYCSNDNDPSPDYGNTGGVAGAFTSTGGLVWANQGTGQVDVSGSTAGTYTVTNTIVAANGCVQVVETSSIVITTLPVATFSYAGTPYCSNDADPSPD